MRPSKDRLPSTTEDTGRSPDEANLPLDVAHDEPLSEPLSESEVDLWTREVREAVSEDVGTSFDGLSPMAKLSATLIGYEVVRELGRGGMGVVYEARQKALNRRVALKVLPALLGAVRPDAIARFQREAELAAQFKHTNIIGVYDFGDADGTLYYAMELIEGRSLRSVLDELGETGTIDAVVYCRSVGDATDRRANRTKIGSSGKSDRAYYRQIAEWTSQIGEALQYAHDRGVIHRDVKPSNLLLNIDGRLMLSDFGLSRHISNATLTRSHAMIGTARYMAPEQIEDKGEPVDARADVYGLGATMYELLTLRPMFDQADDRDVIHHVLTSDPVRPGKLMSSVPADLETICLKAIEKQPSKRYATAKAMRDDLERWLLGMPILAKPANALQKTWKRIRRRPLVTSLAGCLLVLVITTASLATRQRVLRQRAAEAEAENSQRGVELLRLDAEQELAAGRFHAAIDRVDKAIQSDPSKTALRRLRALILIRMDRRLEARDILESVIATTPGDWSAHGLLSMIYYGRAEPLAGQIYRQDELMDSAKAAFHLAECERLAPNTADVLLLKSLREPDHAKAIALLDEALQRDPMDIYILGEREKRLEASGNFAAALLDAERIIAKRPNWLFGYLSRGNALGRMSRFSEAIAAYNDAIRIDPLYTVAWYCRGEAKRMLRDPSAVDDFNEAIRLDDQYGNAYTSRALVRSQSGQTEKALADIARAIEIEPGKRRPYMCRIEINQRRENWDAVISDCTRLLQVNPTDSEAFNSRLTAYRELGQHQRIVDDCSRMLETDGDSPSLYLARASALAAMRQFEAAEKDRAKVIQLLPVEPKNYDAHASLAMRVGQYGIAIQDLSLLLKKSANDPLLLMRRGMAREAIGRVDGALADYELASHSPGPIADYAQIWTFIASQLAEIEDAGLPAHRASSPWTAKLFSYFTGELTAYQLAKQCATKDERAEAHYYIGCKALINGDRDDAATEFRSCVGLDRSDVVETDFARARLAQLEKKLAAKTGG